MPTAKPGDFVQVFYTGSLTNGEVFDSNEGGAPLEFQINSGGIIPGFNDAVLGMDQGQEKEVSIPPEQAYGMPDERMVMQFPLKDVPSHMKVELGMTLQLTTPDGRPLPARVTSLDDENMTLDLNSPLAGQTLVFKIRLAGVTDQPTQMAAGCGCGCGSEPGGGCGPDPSGGCGGGQGGCSC